VINPDAGNTKSTIQELMANPGELESLEVHLDAGESFLSTATVIDGIEEQETIVQ